MLITRLLVGITTIIALNTDGYLGLGVIYLLVYIFFGWENNPPIVYIIIFLLYVFMKNIVIRKIKDNKRKKEYEKNGYMDVEWTDVPTNKDDEYSGTNNKDR